MFANWKNLDMCEVNRNSKLSFLPRFSMLLSHKAMGFGISWVLCGNPGEDGQATTVLF